MPLDSRFIVGLVDRRGAPRSPHARQHVHFERRAKYEPRSSSPTRLVTRSTPIPGSRCSSRLNRTFASELEGFVRCSASTLTRTVPGQSPVGAERTRTSSPAFRTAHASVAWPTRRGNLVCAGQRGPPDGVHVLEVPLSNRHREIQLFTREGASIRWMADGFQVGEFALVPVAAVLMVK